MSHPFSTTLRAFHHDPAIQANYLARVRAHAAADEIVQGTYWQNGRGCAVGCTIHGSSHAAYETELGIPRILARLEDRLFESMAIGDAKGWPERFLAAIPLGADLSLVWPNLAVWLLIDPEHGVVKFAKKAEIEKAIRDVANAYQRMIDGESIPRSELWTLRDEAWRVRSDAADAADADARNAHVLRTADKLLELLAGAPVTETPSAAALALAP
jgi:hypothetical protein